MTRAERIEKAARYALDAWGPLLAEVELDPQDNPARVALGMLDSALALPASEPQGMEGVKKALAEYEWELCGGPTGELFDFELKRRAALLAAVVAYGDQRACAGWRAGREAVISVMNTQYTDVGRCGLVVMKLIDAARALPEPEEAP